MKADERGVAIATLDGALRPIAFPRGIEIAHGAWLMHADGTACIFADYESGAAVHVDLVAGTSVPLAPPWQLGWDATYDWTGDRLWVAHRTERAFASLDRTASAFVLVDDLAMCQQHPAFHRAVDRAQRVGGCIVHVESELARATYERRDGDDVIVGCVSWCDAPEYEVNVGPRSLGRVRILGDLVYVLERFELHIFDRDGAPRGLIAVEPGFRHTELDVAALTPSGPRVVVVTTPESGAPFRRLRYAAGS